MLKEIYVIDQGVLFFHYSQDRSELEEDKAILSSGFLAAIKDFSETTRSEVVDTFSTTNEYFVFTRCCETTKVLVGVFERSVSERLARETLDKIHELIAQTSIPDELQPELGTPEKNSLRTKIKLVTEQLFGVEGAADFLEELLKDRPNIPLAILIDIEEKKEIAHYARPKPLFKEQQVRSFLLVHSNLVQTLKKLGISETYSHFSIRSQNHTISSHWTGKIVGLSTGTPSTPEEEVLSVAYNICRNDIQKALPDPFRDGSIDWRATLLKNGDIIHEKGHVLTEISGIFISTLINNLGSFSKILSNRTFEGVEVFTSEEIQKRFSIQQKETEEDFIIQLITYS